MNEDEKPGQHIFDATYSALATLWDNTSLQRRLDIEIEKYWEARRQSTSNPLLRKGQKYFSQNDEDGISIEIARRIGLEGGTFAEFGVGDGLENNTLILLMSGWHGTWIGGEKLAFNVPSSHPPLSFLKAWITAENCVGLLRQGLTQIGKHAVDFLSIDLDGNDYFVAKSIIDAGLRPAVLVVEYNGKFPPPIKWTIKYDPNHKWDGSDYQGASLQSYVELLRPAGYRLVCCNLTGANAFFVSEKYREAFADVPSDPAELFQPCDYNWFVKRGHPTSPRTVERFLMRG